MGNMDSLTHPFTHSTIRLPKPSSTVSTSKNFRNRILFCKYSPDAPPTFMKSSWDVTFVKPYSDIRDAISKA